MTGTDCPAERPAILRGRTVPGMRSSTALETPRRKLEGILSRPDRDVDLAEASLLVAAEEYAELDVRGYLVRLDEMELVDPVEWRESRA